MFEILFLGTSASAPSAKRGLSAQIVSHNEYRFLIDCGEGLVKLVTLAPEADRGGAMTRFLVERNVTVSAGHTDASLDELDVCIEAGLKLMPA